MLMWRHRHEGGEGDVAIVNSGAVIDERVYDGIGDGDGDM
jgi:hypothetical protein